MEYLEFRQLLKELKDKGHNVANIIDDNISIPSIEYSTVSTIHSENNEEVYKYRFDNLHSLLAYLQYIIVSIIFVYKNKSTITISFEDNNLKLLILVVDTQNNIITTTINSISV